MFKKKQSKLKYIFLNLYLRVLQLFYQLMAFLLDLSIYSLLI